MPSLDAAFTDLQRWICHAVYALMLFAPVVFGLACLLYESLRKESRS